MSDAKSDLRRVALARREALDPEARRRASAAIAAQILARPEFRTAGVLLAYAAMRSEVDPAELVRAALAAGAVVAMPVTDWARRELALRRVGDLDELVTGRFGVPEPSASAEPVTPEAVALVLAPGVAFDPEGRRLGYGAGLYDRLLPRLPAACPRWGLAFEAQIWDRLPAGEHDAPLDAVVTERRWLARRERP
jgi:5-formyltetrahydrofolate cyclo-ligase